MNVERPAQEARRVSAGLATGEPQELVELQTAIEAPLMAAEGRRP
jgi:hypothetical protein